MDEHELSLRGEITGIEIETDEIHGADAGFLRVRRVALRNRRADGTRSDRYICDFVTRPKGPDAVVVVLYHAGEDCVRVLLRRCLRPALALGRAAAELPVADGGAYPFFTEVVAGIIERDDRGRDGVLRRAAIEAEEEAGVRIDPSRFEFLGAGTFPTPGSMPEKFWLVAAHVDDPSAAAAAKGDGSPMEEGSRTRWEPLHEAIAGCVEGRIEDAKTELALRRLADRLA
jgi:ADP-ribose pyrophosphatase